MSALATSAGDALAAGKFKEEHLLDAGLRRVCASWIKKDIKWKEKTNGREPSKNNNRVLSYSTMINIYIYMGIIWINMVRYNYAFWSNIIIFRSNLPCGLLGPDTTCQYFVHLMEYDLLKELMEWTWIKQWWFRHYILLYLFISDIQSFHVGRAEFYQWTLQPSCCNSAKLDQSWSKFFNRINWSTLIPIYTRQSFGHVVILNSHGAPNTSRSATAGWTLSLPFALSSSCARVANRVQLSAAGPFENPPQVFLIQVVF